MRFCSSQFENQQLILVPTDSSCSGWLRVITTDSSYGWFALQRLIRYLRWLIWDLRLNRSHPEFWPRRPLINLSAKKSRWINLFIGNLPSFTQKLCKSYKCGQKKYLDFVSVSSRECITVGSFTSDEFFYFLKYIINTNIWKLKCLAIGEMIDSNDTWILRC